MNKRQKEVIQTTFDDEKKVIRQIEKMYVEAREEIIKKITELDEFPDMQSKIYQKKYQQLLLSNIERALKKLQNNEYDTISKYIEDCYYKGFIGTVYDMHGQGVPLILPINNEEVVNAITNDTKLKHNLYKSLGIPLDKVKKRVNEELSRGILTGANYTDMARNISHTLNLPRSRANTIARTEGHRVSVQATFNAQLKAKENGADVVKQWDSALDSRVRPSHKQVDGEIRELDEPFSNGLMFPGDSNGKASEVVNCRCALLQRAKWALDDDELKTLKERASFHQLDKSEQFKDFEKKYVSSYIVNFEENDIINLDTKTKRLTLNKKGTGHFTYPDDPMFDAMGPAYKSHPKEIEAFIKQINELGVEYLERQTSLGYSPGLFQGNPGQIRMSPNASYSAWLHEMQHLYDDFESGWVGMRILEKPDVRFQWEIKAYNIEIELAIKIGRKDIAKQLKNNLEKERKRIYENPPFY